MKRLWAYKAIVLAVQAFVCAVPFGSRLLERRTFVAIPPLGDGEEVGLWLGFLLIGLLALVPLIIKSKKTQVSCLCLTLVISAACVFWCFALEQRYVKTIPTPNGSATFSIGNERSAFASVNYAGQTDEQMLMDRGFEESDIQFLWTQSSITRVRIELFLAYVASLSGLNFAVGSLGMLIIGPVKRAPRK